MANRAYEILLLRIYLSLSIYSKGTYCLARTNLWGGQISWIAFLYCEREVWGAGNSLPPKYEGGLFIGAYLSRGWKAREECGGGNCPLGRKKKRYRRTQWYEVYRYCTYNHKSVISEAIDDSQENAGGFKEG